MSEYSAVSFKIEADNKPALSAIEEVRTALKDLKVNFKFTIPKSTIKSAMKAMTEEVNSEARKLAEAMENATSNTFGSSKENVWDEATLSALRLEGAIQQINGNIAAMKMYKVDPFEEATQHVEEYKEAMYSLGDAIGSYMSMGNAGGYTITDVAMDAFKVPEAYIMDLDTANTRLSTMATNLEDITDEWSRAVTAAEDFSQWNANGDYTLSLSDPITTPESISMGNSQFADMVDGMRMGIRDARMESDQFWSAFARGAEKALSIAKQGLMYVGRLAATCATGLKNLAVSGFDKLTSSIRNSTKGLNNLFNSIKRIAMYRALRTAIKMVTSSLKEGIENLYRWSRLNDGEFSGSMDKLATEALHVKNALGAMLAPVINALTPIVEKLAHAFINVVNSINQFISALTGASTWTKALHTPITYAQAAGSSFDKAKKKAKELKATILGFDEINRLNGNTDSDTDSNELPYGSMFEKVPLNNFWKDWLKKLDWTDLGRLAAQKANAFLAKADKWILNVARPWAMKWSTRIATFLNGLVEDFNWELLGKTVADGLMVIVDSVNNFFDLFRAKDFGRGLARTIDGWFRTMDWDAVGRFFSNKLNFIIDTAYGFFGQLVNNAGTYGKMMGEAFKAWVDNIHWDELSQALKDGFRSVADFMWGFADESRDSWEKFLNKTIGIINEVISNPDTSRIISGFDAFVNKIIEKLPDVDWRGIGQRVGELIAGIEWGEFIGNALEAMALVFDGMLEGILKERLDNAAAQGKKWFGDTGEEFKRMGAEITKSSLETGVNVAKNLKDMSDTTDDVFTKLGGATYDFTDEVKSSVAKFLSEASNGSAESMKQLSDDTVKIFSDVSDAISKINQALSNSFSRMASSISESMQRMYNNVSTNMTRIAKNVEDNARRIQNAFGSISGQNLNIRGYASGGFPEDGLFYANHNELVGGFANGKTAVANNAEIISGISQGVYQAFTSAMGNQNSSGDIVIRIDSEEIARASIKGQRRIDRRMNPTVKFTG